MTNAALGSQPVAPAQQSYAPPATSMPTRVRCQFDLMGAIGHLVLWIIISVVTLGIGFFFFQYAFANYMINRTYLLDGAGNPVARLHSQLDLGQQIGHIVIWIFISIITLGFGSLLYMYTVWSTALAHTIVVAPNTPR